jgi:outer membrane protein assembly factor BamB
MKANRLELLSLISLIFLSACNAGERLGALNPFAEEETDEELGHAEGTERIPVLALQESLDANLEAAPVSLPQAYVNRAWPQADGYPTHAMQHTQASGQLSQIWREDIGEGSSKDRRLNNRPLIAEGAVFTLDAEGRVSSRSLETGDQNWVRRLSVENEASRGSWIPFRGGGDEVLTFGGGLSYDSGRIYVHIGDNRLFSLDASDGSDIWSTESFTPFHASPTISDGRVFVSTDDNELMAFGVEDGTLLWSYRAIAETARLMTAPSPAVLGDVVIAPFSSGEVVALLAQNGSVLWSDSLTRAGGLTPLSSINDIAASPIILGEDVYAVSHSGIMASFDLRTGERKWTLPASALHTPAIAGDYIFLITTYSQVSAIDRNTGQVRWITQLRNFKNMNKREDRISWAGPILAGNRLLLASSNGEMLILDPSTGEQTGDINLRQSVYIAPVLAEETVVVLTDEGRLIALR